MSQTRHARALATALLVYGVVAIGLTWPLVRDFQTRLLGDVWYDMRHAQWILWHVKEALSGRQPWFSVDLLYYPHGISTLVDGVGPVSGLLALPFWPWGPEAAYNGATLTGFALSGWCMCVLARYGVGGVDGRLSWPAAGFAGLVFMLWPFHVSSLIGHLEKAFIGLLPLTVLAGLLAYAPSRSRGWLMAPAVTLLLILLHNGNQFTFALLALMWLAVVGVVRCEREQRRTFIRRVIASGAIAVVVTGPLLLALARAAYDPKMDVSLGRLAPRYTPDLLQLVVPSAHQALLGRFFYPESDVMTYDFARASRIAALSPSETWYGSGVETSLTVPVTVLGLIAVAIWAAVAVRRASFASRRGTPARQDDADAAVHLLQRGTQGEALVWLLFSVSFAVLALGPFLRIAGTQTSIPLPYRVLTMVPGFDVMRTPGRFMMIASAGFAILAALGLTTLLDRLRFTSTKRAFAAAAVTLLVAAECWPRPWPQQVPPPVPAFYQQIAQQDAAAGSAADAGAGAGAVRYAVLDLPLGRWSPNHASAYMYYQLTHHKPIAWGYLSRQFKAYPVFGVDGILQDAAPTAIATRARLARLGYRFVVWHKHHQELFASRRPALVGDGRFRMPAADPRTSAFLTQAFADDVPIVDDDLVTVYRIDPP